MARPTLQDANTDIPVAPTVVRSVAAVRTLSSVDIVEQSLETSDGR